MISIGTWAQCWKGEDCRIEACFRLLGIPSPVAPCDTEPERWPPVVIEMAFATARHLKTEIGCTDIFLAYIEFQPDNVATFLAINPEKCAELRGALRARL